MHFEVELSKILFEILILLNISVNFDRFLYVKILNFLFLTKANWKYNPINLNIKILHTFIWIKNGKESWNKFKFIQRMNFFVKCANNCSWVCHFFFYSIKLIRKHKIRLSVYCIA